MNSRYELENWLFGDFGQLPAYQWNDICDRRDRYIDEAERIGSGLISPNGRAYYKSIYGSEALAALDVRSRTRQQISSKIEQITKNLGTRYEPGFLGTRVISPTKKQAAQYQAELAQLHEQLSAIEAEAVRQGPEGRQQQGRQLVWRLIFRWISSHGGVCA